MILKELIGMILRLKDWVEFVLTERTDITDITDRTEKNKKTGGNRLYTKCGCSAWYLSFGALAGFCIGG